MRVKNVLLATDYDLINLSKHHNGKPKTSFTVT